MSIGSVVMVPSLGRLASVVGTTAVGAPQEGRQHMQVHYRARVPETAAGACSGADCAAPTADAPGPLRSVRPAGGCSDCGEDGKFPDRKDSLTAEERSAIDRLRQADAAVKQEEKAHAAAAGAAAGPIRYSYRTGPDGRQYATSGKVPVDFSNPGGDPARLADLAARIGAAANAAASPSAADLSVARQSYRAAAAATEAAVPRLDIVG